MHPAAGVPSPGSAHKRTPPCQADESPPKVICPYVGASPRQSPASTASGLQQATHWPTGTAGSGCMQSPCAGPPPVLQHSNSNSGTRQRLWSAATPQQHQQRQQVPQASASSWGPQGQQQPQQPWLQQQQMSHGHPVAGVTQGNWPQQQQQHHGQWLQQLHDQGTAGQAARECCADGAKSAAGQQGNQQWQHQLHQQQSRQQQQQASPNHAQASWWPAGQQQQQGTRGLCVAQQQQQQQWSLCHTQAGHTSGRVQPPAEAVGPGQQRPDWQLCMQEQQKQEQEQQQQPQYHQQQQVQHQHEQQQQVHQHQQQCWRQQAQGPQLRPDTTQHPGLAAAVTAAGGAHASAAAPPQRDAAGGQAAAPPACRGVDVQAPGGSSSGGGSVSFQQWHQQCQQQQQQQQQQPAAVFQGGHPTATHASRGSSNSSSSNPNSWRPGIYSRIRDSWEAWQAVGSNNVQLLCQWLGEPAWHIEKVEKEVANLRLWLNLTFYLRNVLEQLMVLDFVSTRTLQQLSHLPPHELHQLDTWVAEDLAAFNAADGRLVQPVKTSWAQLCGNWEVAEPKSWKRPPSELLEQLLAERRLVWEPASTSSGAGQGVAGHYRWQHGPVDAWLSPDRVSRQVRAEQLQQSQHPRNQVWLLLSPEAYEGGSSSNSISGSSSSSGMLDWRFGDLCHNSSCHLQRHPVLAAHDRLVRVTLDRHRLAAAGGGGDKVRQQELYRLALEDVLNNGVICAGRRYTRLVQKDVGQDGESLWLLATESVAPEDTWPAINPAAARQLLGGFSSLPSVSKQCARGALLVSNTLPLKVKARNIIYIPDVVGPTDPRGCPLNCSSTSSASGASSSVSSGGVAAGPEAADELVMTDGSGFISQDLAECVPAVSSGELVAALLGQGVQWPRTPLQVRLFDPHLGGVIAKGMLLPLNSNALPPGTVILRQSQVKAPAGKTFWSAWESHWRQLLLWAHRQHQQHQRASLHAQQRQTTWMRQAGSSNATAACVGGSSSGSGGIGSTGGVGDGVLQEAVQAAAAAAATASDRAETLQCFHMQDMPWLQQLWYISDAQQLSVQMQQASGGAQSPPPPLPANCAPQQCLHGGRQQMPQQPAAGAAGVAAAAAWGTAVPQGQHSNEGSSWSGVSSSGSWCGGFRGAAVGCSTRCQCSAVLEVVGRPPDSSGKNADLRINKNLLLLLHDAGVPEEVFRRWLAIEQDKLQHIDASWSEALAAAKESGVLDVQYKLEALIGVELPRQLGPPSAAALFAARGLGSVDSVADLTQNFKPDLQLKEELHDIKVKKRQRLVNLTIPVPSPMAAVAAAVAGVVPSCSSGGINTVSNGTRQLGLPDPTCGAVPEGCVAISPELLSTRAQGVREAIIYRDPGIHPGDVRRVRLMPYPDALLKLIPPGTNGAIFLPSVGSSSLAASLAGGDYDGDLFLLLWEPQVLSTFRRVDPHPYIAPSKGSSSSGSAQSSTGSPSRGSAAGRWVVSADMGWMQVEQLLTQYYSYCVSVAGTMGQAHNLWELLADRHGAGHGSCQELAAMYYRALDAPKTGVEVTIPCQYLALEHETRPPWHSTNVKKEARAAAMNSRGGRPSQPQDHKGQRPPASKLCRSLWLMVRELPPLDHSNPELLDCDPDLVLQEGPDATPMSVMMPFLNKWHKLAGDWGKAWSELLQIERGGTTADYKAYKEEKALLRRTLELQLQKQLYTGAEQASTQQLQTAANTVQSNISQVASLMGAAALGSSGFTVWSTPLLLVNASACYQAAYLRARTTQQRGNNITPRVAMPWRIAGQYLRLLKVLRHQLQQQQPTRQLGSLQHPLLAQAHLAQHQSASAQRRFRGSARLADDAAATAEMQGLALL